MKFVACLEKQHLGDFSNDDISLGRLCELVEADAGNGMVRIIDESGEDYLYPSSWFDPVLVRDAAALRLHDALTKLVA
jgi:hypothetical protein